VPFPGLSAAAWHLFTAVLQRQPTQSVFRVYVDAQLVKATTSTQFTNIAYDIDMPPLIGAIQVSGPWQFWNGGIDDLRVYDRALSRTEVAELFYGGEDPNLTIEVNDVLLCWHARTNVLWQLQYRSDLTANAWVDFGTPVPGSDRRICFTNSVLDYPRKFYRVVPVSTF
jgi:hypothetical protein